MNWLVIGAGISGRGAVDLLLSEGETVFLFDDNPNLNLTQTYKDLLIEPLKAISLLAHPIDGGIVVSPGIDENHQMLVEARRNKVPIWTELDIALSRYSGKVVAVTGTNGKSTTVMMIHHILKNLDLSVSVGGNIGLALSAEICRKTAGEIVVLEVSSYQAEMTNHLHSEVALITSFSFDHQARHKTMKNYLAAKWRIITEQPITGHAIIAKDAWCHAVEYNLPGPQAGLTVVDPNAIPAYVDYEHTELDEPHNQFNGYMAILAVSRLTGRSPLELAPLLKGFRKLSHRFEVIGSRRNKLVINDSKGTNLEATKVALGNLQGPIVLFLGGQGKGEDFGDLILDRPELALVIAFGQSGSQVVRDLDAYCPIAHYATLREALSAAPQILKDKTAHILFSPGCASQDEFANFEVRGDFFRSQISPLLD